MDPSRCMNPNAFKEKDESKSQIPRNITVVDNVSDRLRIAAGLAKKEISKKAPPPPVVEIRNEEKCSIVIRDYQSPTTGVLYFLIYRNADGENSPLTKVPKDRYRYVYFCNLHECRVFVMTKLIRLMFHGCDHCQISLRSPVIGMAEFFKCSNTNIHIRTGNSPSDGEFPIVRIEDCKKFNIFQSNDEMIYLIYMCQDITGTIIDPITKERQSKYNLGKLFWGEQEQTLVCLSRNEGFASISVNYALNDITQHVIVKPPDDEEIDIDPSVFGTTPPIHSYMSNFKK